MEFEFTLPKGYVDSSGDLHRDGIMRLATAADEIIPLRDPRALKDSSYLPILTLSRVITRLGDISMVTPEIIGDLCQQDSDFLRKLYEKINGMQNGLDQRNPDRIYTEQNL